MEYAKKIHGWATVIITYLGFIIGLADYFNFNPWFDVIFQAKKDISAYYELFPGNRIRLIADFSDRIQKDEINNVKWILEKDKNKFEADGFTTDVIIPPEIYGLLKLSVYATFDDGREIKSKTNLSVTHSEPTIITLKENVTINAEKIYFKNNKKLFYYNSATGCLPNNTYQILSKNNEWKDVNFDCKNIILKENSEIAISDGHAFLRSKKEPENLNKFGVIEINYIQPLKPN